MASFRGLTWLRLAPATAPCASRTCIPNNTTRGRCVQSHGPAHRAGTTLVAAGKLAATSCERRRSGRVCSGAVLTHADAAVTRARQVANTLQSCPNVSEG